MSKSSAPKKIEELSYEEAMQELESIVASLEEGTQKLEEAIALFERGQALMKRCAELLEAADLKVRQLAGDELTPFAEEE
ncbi:MAG: exodeoxyribonuclease VII small subunit [Chloroflexi bacterium RIFOXYD12_FULL_57_15]|nr:MAG: exodeoxyribonuclease VII small subunit [Chloroflexi bacterium RIFOXYD12_FULL_57_15]